MIFETFAVGQLGCNCTIVADEASGNAIVIDGGDGVDEVVDFLTTRSLRATHLIHTHAHFDHIGDLARLRELTGGVGLLHPADVPLYHKQPLLARQFGLPPIPPPAKIDGDLLDGDRLQVGGTSFEVLHTPGHTPGSVCFAVKHGQETTLLTGDTLFAGSIGRWDLGGTSMEDIVDSIQRKLMDFSDMTTVVPGHGPLTTIGTERSSNPYLRTSR